MSAIDEIRRMPDRSTLGDRAGSEGSSGPATAAGLVAVLLWSSLALLTKEAGAIPPFQLLAMSFAVAFSASVAILSTRGRGAFRAWRQPPAAWLSGFAGIFTYHALYFYALEAAPAAEASLIAYLWPLLIVLLSTFVEGGTPRLAHLGGAVLGFVGTALLVLGAGHDRHLGAPSPLLGYAAALGCAFTWALYSVGNRRLHRVSSELIGGICGLVAVAAFACHLAFERSFPLAGSQWVAVALLGLGPVGAAFFAWDYATKHGRMTLLGALSYLAPLISTFLLVVSGNSSATLPIILASVLIVAGAALAASRK